MKAESSLVLFYKQPNRATQNNVWIDKITYNKLHEARLKSSYVFPFEHFLSSLKSQ